MVSILLSELFSLFALGMFYKTAISADLAHTDHCPSRKYKVRVP